MTSSNKLQESKQTYNLQETQNLLTFDIEEWFHILDLQDNQPKFSDWDAFPPRLEFNVERLLELLSGQTIRATFFILGWIAKKYPSIVNNICSLGHEIASHGYKHDLIYDLTREKFRDDIRRAKGTLEDITGKAVRGYRGPGFSITSQNLWALDIIVEEGFEYDATLYPGSHGHGGIHGLPSEPFVLITPDNYRLVEYPASVCNIGGYQIGFSGGGYFRLFPLFIITRLIKSFNNRGAPVLIYMHPRDLDPETPKLQMPFIRQFKCYVNLSHSYEKLRNILSKHSFLPISEWEAEHRDNLKTVSIKEHFSFRNKDNDSLLKSAVLI